MRIAARLAIYLASIPLTRRLLHFLTKLAPLHAEASPSVGSFDSAEHIPVQITALEEPYSADRRQRLIARSKFKLMEAEQFEEASYRQALEELSLAKALVSLRPNHYTNHHADEEWWVSASEGGRISLCWQIEAQADAAAGVSRGLSSLIQRENFVAKVHKYMPFIVPDYAPRQ